MKFREYSPAVLELCRMKLNRYLHEKDPLIASAVFEDLKRHCLENHIGFNESDQNILRQQREYVFGREE